MTADKGFTRGHILLFAGSYTQRLSRSSSPPALYHSTIDMQKPCSGKQGFYMVKPLEGSYLLWA